MQYRTGHHCSGGCQRQVCAMCCETMSCTRSVVLMVKLRRQLACVSCNDTAFAVAQSLSIIVYVLLPVRFATCTTCCSALALNCLVPLLLLLVLLQQDSIDATLLLALLQSPEAVYSGYYLANANTFMRLQGPQVVLDAIMGDPMLPPDVVAHLLDTLHNVSTIHTALFTILSCICSMCHARVCSCKRCCASTCSTVAYSFDKPYRTMQEPCCVVRTMHYSMLCTAIVTVCTHHLVDSCCACTA
jgi:hypothetical protein